LRAVSRPSGREGNLPFPANEQVTLLLRAWAGGDEAALEKLTPIIYEELRRLARYYMSRERSGHILQTTALVNEAYLRLADCNRMTWQDRAHFLAVSAQMMRRILVDHARRNNKKRGAGYECISLEAAGIVSRRPSQNLAALDDALESLAKFDTRKAKVVELRFFGGLSVEETAEVLKVSAITVMRDWSTARTWLYRELKRDSAYGSRALETS
jgi:RNA polymerase sigma-70 factor, ECF subfamily